MTRCPTCQTLVRTRTASRTTKMLGNYRIDSATICVYCGHIFFVEKEFLAPKDAQPFALQEAEERREARKLTGRQWQEKKAQKARKEAEKKIQLDLFHTPTAGGDHVRQEEE